KHRNRSDCPVSTEFDGGDKVGITLNVRFHRCNIGDLSYPMCSEDLPESRIRWWSHQIALAVFDVRGWCIVCRYCAETIGLPEIQRAKPGLANARRIYEYSVKYGFKVARRA